MTAGAPPGRDSTNDAPGAPSDDQGQTDPFDLPELQRLRAQVARLETERTRLQAQVAARSAVGGSHRLRKSTAALLAAVCCVLIFLSAITVWIHQTAISTSGFVATVGPIIDRPSVTQAMSVELTDQIFAAVDLDREVKHVLPAAEQFLATPLANAAQGFVQSQMLTVLRSSQFRAVWITILQATHHEVIAALRGQSAVLAVSNGTVVLNVLPLVDVAMQQVQSLASGLLGHNITIPKVTSGEVPPQIRSTLSKALGVNLPADFGQIELAKSSSLDLAKQSVRTLDILFWLLPLITLLVIAAALWLSPNRRRTVLQILVGTAVVLIVEKRAESWIASRVVSSLTPANRAAGGDIVHQLLSGLATATWWVLIIALIAVAILVMTGPYTWARHVRAEIAHVSQGVVQAVARRGGDQATVVWVVEHHRILQAGGAVVGGILLLLVPGWWFFVVAVVLVAYEAVIWRVVSIHRGTTTDEAHDPGPPSPLETGLPASQGGAPTRAAESYYPRPG